MAFENQPMTAVCPMGYPMPYMPTMAVSQAANASTSWSSSPMISSLNFRTINKQLRTMTPMPYRMSSTSSKSLPNCLNDSKNATPSTPHAAT